jgi:hypothetical protein
MINYYLSSEESMAIGAVPRDDGSTAGGAFVGGHFAKSIQTNKVYRKSNMNRCLHIKSDSTS